MPPILRGRRSTLRPPAEADIDARLQLGNDPGIHRLYGGSQADLRPLTPRTPQAGFAGWLPILTAGRSSTGG